MDREHITSAVLRVGVAFAFLYAGIAGFINPEEWVGWFPKFISDIVPQFTLLQIWDVYEIITGLWILSGKKIFWPSVAASLSLAGLILTNLGAMDVIFRDVTILAAAIALTIESFPRKTAN